MRSAALSYFLAMFNAKTIMMLELMIGGKSDVLMVILMSELILLFEMVFVMMMFEVIVIK